MHALLAIATFVGAAVLAIFTIVMMIAPQWHRIVRLASGQVEPQSQRVIS